MRLFEMVLAFFSLTLAGAHAQTIAALSTNGEKIVLIDSKKLEVRDTIKLKGGKLLAMDIRARDGKLYGVTSKSELVTISTDTGKITSVATLSRPLQGGYISFDHTAATDTFRLVSDNAINFSVDPDSGFVTRNGDLNNGAVNPEVIAVAHTNAFFGAESDELYAVSVRDQLLCVIRLPGFGTCEPVGDFGLNVKTPIAFDILTKKKKNFAYVIFERKLREVDLSSGKFGKAKSIKNLKTSIRDMAFLP